MSSTQARPFSDNRWAVSRWNDVYNTSTFDKTSVVFQGETLAKGSQYVNGRKIEVRQQPVAEYEKSLLKGIRDDGSETFSNRAVRAFLEDARKILDSKPGERTLGQLRWLEAEAFRFRYRPSPASRKQANPVTATGPAGGKKVGPVAGSVSTTPRPALSGFISDIGSRVRAIPDERIKDWQDKAGLYLKVGQVDGIKGRFTVNASEDGERGELTDANDEYAPGTFTILYDESHLEERLVVALSDDEFNQYDKYKDGKTGEHPELTAMKKDSGEYQRLKAFEDAVQADDKQVSILQDYTGGFYSVANAALRAGAEAPEDIARLAAYTNWNDRPEVEPAEVCQRIADTRAAFDAVAVELPTNITLHRAMESYGKFPEDTFDQLAGTVLQDPAFTSTSYGNASASRFGFMPIQLHLHVTEGVKGVPAKPFSLSPSENEIILPPNTRFLVLATRVDDDGKRHVDMAVLPGT